MRRAKRGGGVSPAVIEELGRLLRAEIDVRTVVHEALRTVLNLDEGFAIEAQPLRALPEYNSFRLLDVIDRVESRLGVTVDPDDLTAESLRDVGTLCDLFAKAARA
jgi:acyl carrier protein